MRMGAVQWFMAGAAALLLLGGCTTSQPYRTTLAPRPTLEGRLPVPQEGERCPGPTKGVVFVEYDDYGNLMNRSQLRCAVEAATQTALAKGTVLVYVHGWHHDANRSDDVKDFQNLVQRISDLDRGRRSAPGAGNILGVYVGWRGDSIHSTWPAKPFSYLLTFWDRKSAAHDIGNSGGVYELFSRLSEVRRANKGSKLLVHGHSFGGAVVYSSVAQKLMDQIRMDASDVPSSDVPVADLVLLLNPAFEAMKLRPQLDLARTLEFKRDLPPRLVIVTTEADWATGITFPIGRGLGTPFDFYADEHSPLQNRTAIGHYIPYVTHQLAPVQPGECDVALPSGGLTLADLPMMQALEPSLRQKLLEKVSRLAGDAPPQGGPRLPDVTATRVQSLNQVMDENRPMLCIGNAFYSKAERLALRRCDEAGYCAEVADRHFVPRGPVAQGLVPYRLPVMNIRTTRAVSSGHNDIRNDTLENFILQLLALAVSDPRPIPAPNPGGASLQ